jgi:hypothetical protein
MGPVGRWKNGSIAIALTIGVAVLAGCGSSGRRTTDASSTAFRWGEYPVKFLPGGVRTLATQRMPWGQIAIIAERYTFQGRINEKLADREELSGRSHRHDGGGSGGLSIERGRPVQLELGTEQGCTRSRPYAFAYGMLRAPKDTVTAEARGRTVRFSSATVPAIFHPDGVLVYALLRPGQNQVVVRAPSGQVVEHEDWSGQDPSLCRPPASVHSSMP